MRPTEIQTSKRLMLIYGNTHITLEKAVADWLPHISFAAARRRAKTQSLPWPVIASEPSQKAELFVSITAIAEWIDQKEQTAQKEWEKVNK